MYPPGEDIVLVGVLSGAAWFTCDLARELAQATARGIYVDWVKVRTYSGMERVDQPTMLLHPRDELIKGRRVIVVEDVVDTGHTACFVLEMLRAERYGARSVELVALVSKATPRTSAIVPMLQGFVLPSDWFIVGYGMDYNERFRNMPYLARCKKVTEGTKCQN